MRYCGYGVKNKGGSRPLFNFVEYYNHLEGHRLSCLENSKVTITRLGKLIYVKRVSKSLQIMTE